MDLFDRLYVAHESAVQSTKNPALIDKLHHFKLLTSETEVLDIAAKGSLSDITMSTLSTKLFGSYPTVDVASPNLANVAVNGSVFMDRDVLFGLFIGVSIEMVLIPINCNGNH
ncbi:unnamed protein product [Phytophthora fragariaefolia]|uniref:Unnamed protein product n=1 Tax=Phytophthora fragariaefolia TaxID=1490495 RepID=A0A9W6XZ52_9STRA|nr:unnamed protein product [Phytophthora fragariaefolia]